MSRFDVLLLSALAALGTGTAAAADYHPGFTCPRPNNGDLLATTICVNQSMAREELLFEKTYYAHRQQDGVQAYHALKVQAVAFNTTLRAACDIPMAGSSGLLPPTAPTCYVDQTKNQVKAWNNTLRGVAHDEGSRDIDTHMLIQQKLIDAGFLPGSQADGIYGDATRIAIVRWQESKHRPATGFISDDEVGMLLPDRMIPASAAIETPAVDVTAAPPVAGETLASLSTSDVAAQNTSARQHMAAPVTQTSALQDVASPSPPTPAAMIMAVAPPQPAVDNGPSEALFLSTVADFHQKYDAAENDFLKGTVFQQRNAALRAVFAGGTAVHGWTGTVYRLSSNGDGKGVLEVTLSKDAWLATQNNSFSDIGSNTLIESGSPVYAAMGTLKEGDEVVFSGVLHNGDADDSLETQDLTMNSKMTEPEFVFTFESLAKR